MSDDDAEHFDWNTWAEDDPNASARANHANGGASNGHRAGARDADTAADDVANAAPDASGAGWVASGGVMHWEEPESEAADPRAEAESPLAADELDMPEGAPGAPRVRAVHAWMVRQRVRLTDALGELLLAQRDQRAAEPPPSRRASRRADIEISPLELAIAEHQAAADEYDALLAALEEHAAHAGPGQALVDFYLWLSDHLAEQAAMPEAAVGAAPPTTRETAAWRGHAMAALAARGRVERMTAPALDE